MTTRNFSLHQLQNLHLDEARIVADALAASATARQVESAASALAALTEKALQGDRQAYAAYQQLLYILSLSDDVPTALTRRWLANAIYRVEERFMPAADLSTALSEADFQQRLEQEIAAQSRERHPMSQYVFSGSASRAQLQVFLRHQWFRTFRLYRDAADLLVNLTDVDEAAALARYLYGELGEEDEKGSHPRLLAKLLEAIGLEADFQAVSTMPEEIAYLNNRARSFRHPEAGWGLAVVLHHRAGGAGEPREALSGPAPGRPERRRGGVLQDPYQSRTAAGQARVASSSPGGFPTWRSRMRS
ncbi:Pyrroloquinoline quinone (Coenzyme PQQ) biosynthesis protein C [Pseudomonas aeruginosa]|nr:Pyrroloquinoline quinone (Coenzyme PQQ) biosynthesis protein C [Pseudomonas aeruginosa]